MRNRNVGFLIVGLAFIIGIIIWIFNVSMKSLLGDSCSMGPSCSMYAGLATQTYLTLAVAGIILVIGLFLIFSKENERIVVKKEKLKKRKINLEGLSREEREVIKLLQQENNAVFQASLMEKLNIGKVKATRLLDKLEAKQLIERKRRGMNNIIVLR